jgi:uncharacterized protein DUF4235
MKILFLPFSILGGFLAGFIAKKSFEVAWGIVDDEEAPEPEHRDVPWTKLLLAMAIEGAIFAAVRGLFDRGSREAFFRLTGSWPGEEEPETT